MKIKIDIKPKDILKFIKNASKKALEESEAELSCKCGHKIRKSLRWLQNNKNFRCPACGTLFNSKKIGEILKSLD